MKLLIFILLFAHIFCWTVSCDQVSAGRGQLREQDVCDSLGTLQLQFNAREWDILKMLSTAADPGAVYREELDGLLQPEAASFCHKLRMIRNKLDQVLPGATVRPATDSLRRSQWLAHLQGSGCVQGAAAMNLGSGF